MMEEVNWNNFKAKFHDHEQRAFERLCYLLFCKEHGKDTTIDFVGALVDLVPKQQEEKRTILHAIRDRLRKR